MSNPLDRLAVLMWDEFNQHWKARARGSNSYVHDEDPEQAILKATEPKEEDGSTTQSETDHQENLG